MKHLQWMFALLLTLLVGQVAAATPVDAYELRLFLEGRTAECIKTKDDSLCDTFFGKDGGIKRFTHADKKRRQGRWWIDEKGLLNVQWTGKKKPLSFVVNDRGDGTWELVRKGKVKSVIVSAQPGNQLGW